MHFETKRRTNPARSYSVEAIIEAAPGSTVSLRHESKQEFWNYNENNFLVMPDGKTIVGRDGEDLKKLVAEDITTNNATQIGTLISSIQTVLYDPETRSLFAGDYYGHLHQYQYEHQKSKDTQSFSLVKDYGDIGLGELLSSEVVGDVAIFGGSMYCFCAVELRKMQLVKGTFKTAFQSIDSLQACKVSKSRTLLSVGGSYPSYSESTSDILEIKTATRDDTVTLDLKTETKKQDLKSAKSTPPDSHLEHPEKMMKALLSDVFAYLNCFLRKIMQIYQSRLLQIRKWEWTN